MLIYSPAFDLSHCIFRMLYITNILNEDQAIEIDKIRIIDFYLAYPGCINEFKFPSNLVQLKKDFKDLKKDYRNPINSKITFQRMSILQKKALASILSLGYLDIESYKNGEIKKTNKKITSDIRNQLSGFSFYGDNRLPLMIIISLLDINLNSENGLKARSGLMEYRYEHN
ncbi:ABC-three component system middle component 5 [Acinetobacter calcoaceticus]